MKALDIDAVRAFVLAADLQSFTRAADRLDTTQSAVSLKLQRLERQLGRRLLERTPRQVRLSADGAAFLANARELVSAHDRAIGGSVIEQRRLVVGISHQLVGAELPQWLRRMRDHDADLVIEVRVAGSQELMTAYDRGELDAVLVLRPDERRKQGRIVSRETFSWYADAAWKRFADGPLPLATQGSGCRIRAAAVRALEKAGVAWNEVFVGKGAAIVGSAVSAGLAVGLLSRRTAPVGTVDVSAVLSLPPIAALDVMLYSALSDRRSRDALRSLSLAFQ